MLADTFPGLATGEFRITSPPSHRYNCVAWAAGDSRRWWWPSSTVEVEYWPPTVVRAETMEAFEQAFALLGFVVCEGAEAESDCEKVAVYANADGSPTHAARQLANGRWTSKLGVMEDIEHALHDLEGNAYGKVTLTMKRPRSRGMPSAGG